MVLSLTEVFAKIAKIMPAYNKLSAVILRVEEGLVYVSGVARGQSFGFKAELKDTVPNFMVTLAPEVIERTFKLDVSLVEYTKGSLRVLGACSTVEGAPQLEIMCEPVIEALASDVAKIDAKTVEYVGVIEAGSEICKVSDVLKSWQALAKCGKRIFITSDMSYATSPSANAFYVKEGTCKNLPETPEPVQADSAFVAELSAIQQAFSTDEFNVYTLMNGTVFVALSADRSVFAVEGAPVRVEKNTLERITRRYADVGDFGSVTLPQSAIRDVLQTAADKVNVEVRSEADSLTFISGALGKIKVDTSEFDCACEVAREHTNLALSALPSDTSMVFGYGESDGRNFLSFTATDVTIIVPVQDITEVD